MQSFEEDDLKRLCEELDAILEDFFQSLKQLLAVRQELDKTMKEGFFLMARARYSMGVKSVTSTQYNPDDLQKAFSHVNMLTSGDGSVQFQPEITLPKSQTSASGRMKNSKEPSLVSDGESEFVEMKQFRSDVSSANVEKDSENQSVLRRRNVPKDSTAARKTSSDAIEDLVSGVSQLASDDKMAESASEYGKNPLLWFGILVPQQLRQSQTSFRSAVELSCKIATLQTHLIERKATFEEKLIKKRELVALLCKKCGSTNDVEGETDVLKNDALSADSDVNGGALSNESGISGSALSTHCDIKEGAVLAECDVKESPLLSECDVKEAND